MDVFEVLYTTRAMRRMSPAPVGSGAIAQIVDAAIRAPAGGGEAKVRFLAVTDPRVVAEIATVWQDVWVERRGAHFEPTLERLRVEDPEAARKQERLVASTQHLVDHFESVPLVLCAFGREGDEASVFPAAWSACLAARALGIGSVFTTLLARLRRAEIEAVLRVPADSGWMLMAVLPMGVPLGRWGTAPRRPAHELCYADHWGTAPSWRADGPVWSPPPPA